MPESSTTVRKLPTLSTRASRFSYVCGSCGRCCRDKIIHLSPYEIARLARNRGVTTTELIRDFTTDVGTVLAVQRDGRCVFLGETGCEVHADRPLVCRLYPLGRYLDDDGEERFVELTPDARSTGVYGDDGSVGEWLESQGANPFIRAAHRYQEVLGRMLALLDRRRELVATETERSDSALASRALDMDPTIARHAAELGLALPDDVDEKLELHLAALHAWLDHAERSLNAV